MRMKRVFFFSSRRRHTRYWRDWSSDVCSSDLDPRVEQLAHEVPGLPAPELHRAQRTPLDLDLLADPSRELTEHPAHDTLPTSGHTARRSRPPLRAGKGRGTVEERRRSNACSNRAEERRVG